MANYYIFCSLTCRPYYRGIFNFHDKSKKLRPKTIKIQKDGMLTDDFGSGFFDEANNLAIALFDIKQAQSN
jgi:hypothetical protein